MGKKWLNIVYNEKSSIKLKQHYKSWANNYDQDLIDWGYAYPSQLKKIMSQDIKLKKNSKILDAGCGTGLVAKVLDDMNFKNIVGLDYSIDMLKIAKDKKIYTNIGIKNFEVSAKKLININNLSEYLLNKTTIFVGNSGSGKSTLTSALTGKAILSKALSNNQGVHTTSVSTLYNLNGMQIIDSPGVRDIGLDHLGSEEIILGFLEISDFSRKCDFPNCSHQKDKGCAVINAVKNGDISESRYNNFMNLSNGKENG